MSALSRARSFRMAPDGSTPVRSESELEERLHRRLRLLSYILAWATGALAATTIVLRWERIAASPRLLWVDPPLPGILLAISVAAALLAWRLSPTRRHDIALLRRLEWLGVILTAGYFALNQAIALAQMLPGFLRRPMELGVAQGAPWGILIVGYAVLVPSSMRHAMLRTSVIAVVAFLPELIRMPAFWSQMASADALAFLSLKVFIIATMSALGLYGSYRIEALGEEAAIARELGQYLLRRVIGEGGMGSVYLAEHRLLKRPCAVKLIRAEQADSEVALARFEREVQS